MNSVETKKGNILLVDDDPKSLMLLEFALKKAFNLTKAASGKEALQILNDGFTPGVIICDLMMPGMNGTEVLKQAIDIVPDATRILITAHESSKEIINAINKAHAFMFIKKPWDRLELFQAAVIAYDKYLSIKRLKEPEGDLKPQADDKGLNDRISELEYEKEDLEKNLIKSREDYLYLQEKIATLGQLMEENDAFPHESALAFSALIRESEIYWFTDHTYSVSIIAKYLAQKLDLQPDAIKRIVTSSLLHNIAIFSLPDDLKFRDPGDLNEEQRDKYFYYFRRAVKILSEIKKLKPYSSIIAQIWEHFDGSGYPKGLPGNRIRIESQVIQLANIYHTNVYALNPETYQQLLLKGSETQTKSETELRHKELYKSLHKKTRWFDHVVLKAFQDLLMDKECPALIPFKEDLTLSLWQKHHMETYAMLHEEKSGNDDEKKDDDLKFDIEDKITEAKIVPTQIDATEVKAGMKVVENLRTINGITIVKADTVLTPDLVKKIKQFDSQHALAGNVVVLLPDHEE